MKSNVIGMAIITEPAVNDMNQSLMVSCCNIEKSPMATVYLLVASPKITLAKMKSIQGPRKHWEECSCHTTVEDITKVSETNPIKETLWW